MRVFFTNLGCKLNQAELERLARKFSSAGHVVVGSLEAADVHVVNSCTVTHVAARDSRKAARRGRRTAPGVRTVLTGCFVNGAPDEAAALAGVDLVVPNESKDDLLTEIEQAFPDARSASTSSQPVEIPFVPLEFGNTRALVKVEDGCNMSCSFCVIPATRGAQRSRPIDAVVDEVQSLVECGHSEIVVTGVQISAYRWKHLGLFDLVTALLEQTSAPRLRLTSIAPWQFDERLLDLLASSRLCRHLHLSLQSGCDATLRRMRRPYTTDAFRQLVVAIRQHVPRVAITTDVIVGFPGESKAEFGQSLRFVDEMSFARIHAFPYSQRPHTEASSMDSQIPHHVRRERMRRMLDIAARAERTFWDEQLGTEATALWERRVEDQWLGMTDNYIRVLSRSPHQRGGMDVVRLARVNGRGVEVTHEHQSGRPGAIPPRSVSEATLEA